MSELLQMVSRVCFSFLTHFNLINWMSALIHGFAFLNVMEREELATNAQGNEAGSLGIKH